MGAGASKNSVSSEEPCAKSEQSPKKVVAVKGLSSEAEHTKKTEQPQASVEPKAQKEVTETKTMGVDDQGSQVQSVEEPASDSQSVSVPSPTISVETKILLGDSWDGKIALKFRWDSTPDVFSEFCDPTGTNWSSASMKRLAPPDAPRSIVLQYRQGMTGTWTEIPCSDGIAHFHCNPSVVEEKAYRGFQSRWIVDGEKYLSPLERAPTLTTKLLSYPRIRNLIKNLPPDKQSVENIPNEDVKRAITEVENIIPMNTWDYSYGVRARPGAVVKGSVALTASEKVQLAVQGKLYDPQVQAELRGTAMKSPIMLVSAALGTVGISLDAIVSNLDFFIPKPAEPDYSLLEKWSTDLAAQDAARREFQSDLNKLFPHFQNGLRVVIPPVETIRRAMLAKRPTVGEVSLPVLVEFIFEKDFLTQHQVQFVFWSGDNYQSRTVVDCLGVESEDTSLFSSEKKKKIWKKYTAQPNVKPGVYRYHWVADGKSYFSGGRPYNETTLQPPNSYEEFVVESQVMFGIGVVM